MIENLQALYEFITSGIYDFVVDSAAYFIKLYTEISVSLMLSAISFSWDIAKQILTDLNISIYLNTAYSSLDSGTINTLNFFRIPECINNILAASTTRYVLKFVRF